MIAFALLLAPFSSPVAANSEELTPASIAPMPRLQTTGIAALRESVGLRR